MPPSIDIKATLIPVGQAITAQPGQHLMVVAGVCIGVYTGRLPDAAQPHQPLTSNNTSPHDIAPPVLRPSRDRTNPVDPTQRPRIGRPPKNPNAPPKPKRQTSRDEPRAHPDIPTTAIAILEYLHQHGRTSGQQLREILGYPKSSHWEWQFREAMSRLIHAGRVVTYGTTQTREYEFVPPVPKEANVA